MVSRNKYAFCWDKRNLSSPPPGKRDSNSDSPSCGGRADDAPGIAATPAAATAAAPASKSLRLENSVELMEVLLLAAAVPLCSWRAKAGPGGSSKRQNYCVPTRPLSTPTNHPRSTGNNHFVHCVKTTIRLSLNWSFVQMAVPAPGVYCGGHSPISKVQVWRH